MPRTTSKYPNDPEQTGWLLRVKQGDISAFNRIVEKYQRPVYNLCYQMLTDPGEAEEAAQEAFLRAYIKLDTYDDSRQFSTWLFAIASHYCLDKFRKRRFQLVPWDDLANCLSDRGAIQPETAVLEAEASWEVRSLLQVLQPDYRVVVILKYWYAMSCQEIAQSLDTTVSAVKSKLFRARKMMAKANVRRRDASNDPSLRQPSSPFTVTTILSDFRPHRVATV